MLLVALLLINWAASVWHARLDFTNEKRFTLSAATKKMLKELDKPITVNVFLKGNYPSGFKKLSGSSEDILREFREISGGKVQYHFISPEEAVAGTATNWGDTLTAMGLFPINLTAQVKQGQQQQLVFPYALITYEDRIVPVAIYQGKTPLINFKELSSAEALLEYNFAEAISKASLKQKPVVGYATGNEEPTGLNTYDLAENVLKPNYEVFMFDPNTFPIVPDTFKVLLIVKPTIPFSEEAKLKIDQYVMNGGKLLVFMDRLNAELDSLQKGEVVAYDRELKINDLMFKYGARVNPDLVMDLQCDFLPFDVNSNGQFELLPWNYFPVLESPDNHAVNKNLGFVSGRFMNSVDTVEADGIKKTILLSSSPNSRTISTPAIISGKENSVEPENEKFKKAHIPLAVLLEGKFSSLYANRATQAMRDSLTKSGKTFLPQGIRESKIIVAGDGDLALNSAVKNEPIPMGMNPYTYGSQREFPFANKSFVENCLNYLININDLSDAKNKDYKLRLLDTKKVEEQRTFWQLVNILAPVLLVVLFALIFQWLRKRKYNT